VILPLPRTLQPAMPTSSALTSRSSTYYPYSNMSHQFTKTDKDRDGQLLFTNGKPDRDGKPRKLLLVGTGVRLGFEHKEEQDIFAYLVLSSVRPRRSQWMWGPAGEEVPPNYDSVKHWLPGFWKKQISGTNSISARDMKDFRSARLYNIF
jgi:hypothetical protein